MRRAALFTIGGVAFALLVLLNSGGYRYGVSDQAFYIPVVLQQMMPDLYPHDAALIGAQDRLLLFDDWFAPILRRTGTSTPAGFLAAYVITLSLLFSAVVGIGRALYASWWTVGGLVIGLTMRHQIPDTAVNSLEGYFHPRLLAFAVCLGAVAVFLRGRSSTALGVIVLAALVHPTTALWFAIWVGVAALVSDSKARPWLLVLAALATAAAGWAVAIPLRDQVVVMDPTWRNVVSVKSYLLPTGWPMLTWVANLAMAALVAVIFLYRRYLGVTSPRETGLVAGAAVLLVLFLVSVPLAGAHIALVVQLQVSRVFWIFDLFGTCYFAWFLIESPVRSQTRPSWLRSSPRPAVVAVVLALSLMRGGYVSLVERAGKPIVQAGLEAGDWSDLMAWATEQPVGTNFLADPIHAARYGSSVRVASGRDVYLEIVKDTAVAIYSTDIALRVSKRIDELGDFNSLDGERALRLADRFQLDYLITEHALDLPEAHRIGRFRVYTLTNEDS